MGKFYKEALKYKLKQHFIQLNEIMAVLNQSRADGKSDDDSATRKKVNHKLLQMESRLLKEIEMKLKAQLDGDTIIILS